tara:strand:- start:8546 stop:10081 length:1536 start_codon:yes stop_codon:yes gene_type:complete
MPTITYKPDGTVLKSFMKSDRFVRGIRGPIGSGTSTACCIEIFRRACAQEPDDKGIRRSRAAIVRNTFPELKLTTAKTWLEWFPENDFGHFSWSPPFIHMIKVNDIELEVIFLALDKPEDIKKLLSLELTFCWINEAREVPKQIVDAATSRLRRFPAMKDGGATWSGLIMDTNAPSEEHWWPIMAGEVPVPEWMSEADRLTLVTPADWEFFTQPPGMLEKTNAQGEVTGYHVNQRAENVRNLDGDYYPGLIQGKGQDWIDVYVMNKLGTHSAGKPVYSTFRQEAHIAKEPLECVPSQDVWVGVDFGLTPAAIFAQSLHGRWRILKEVVRSDMGAKRFAGEIKKAMGEFPLTEGAKFLIYGDPAGDHRAQTDENTPFRIFRAEGLIARKAPTNDPDIRIEAVETVLNRMIDGQPGILIDPRCVVLKQGFNGGYNFPSVAGTIDQYQERPAKNKASHPHDALQYLMLGAGEGRALTIGDKPAKPHVVERSQNIFDRRIQKGRLTSRTQRFAVH